MHLFVLLIAAVFSSEFVTPNSITELTTTLVLTELNLLMGLPAFNVTAPGRDEETLTFALNSASAGTGKNVSLTTKTQSPVKGVELYEFEGGETDATYATEEELFLIAFKGETVESATTALPVTEALPWRIEPTRSDKNIYTADLGSSPELVLIPGDGEEWYNGMKVKFTSNEEITGISADVTRSANEPYDYTIASGKQLSTLQQGEVTVALFLNGSNVQHPITAKFNITPDFTITPTTTPVRITTSHKKITTLDVETTNKTGWGENINFRLSKTDGDTPVTGQLTDSTKTKWKAENVDLTPLGDLSGVTKLLLEVSVTKDIWLAKTADVAILQPQFTVEKTTIKVSELSAFTEVKVDLNETALTNKVFVVISKTLDLATAVEANDIIWSDNATAGVATVSIVAGKSKLGELVDGHKFYVYASKTSQTDALETAPVPVNIVRDVVTITVTPPTITSAHTSLATLKVVPSPATGWSDPVHFKLTKTGTNTEVTGTLDKDKSVAEWATTMVDLTPLLPWAKNDEITVEISLDEAKTYIPDVGTIAVNVAAFTVQPDEILVSEVPDLDKLTLSFEDEELEGSGKVILSKTIDLKSVGGKDVEKSVTIVKATDLQVPIVTADITKMEGLAAGDVFYVYAAKPDVAAALLAPPVRVVVKADPVEELIYKITPSTATLAEIDALTKITIEPLQGKVLNNTIGVELSLKSTTTNTDPAPLWIASVAKHATEQKWEATFTNAQLKTIGTIAAGSTIIVKVSLKNAQNDYLPKWAEMQVTATPSTDPKFAISPAEVTEGKLTKADSPKFTITIVDGVEKPAIADFAKVIFKAGEKTLTVEFVPSGTAEAPKWEIGAGESDFSTLNITTFPVVGSAEFFPDKAGVAFGPTVPFTFKAAEKPEAAMGISPLFTLLAALVFLFVKLF